VGGYSGASKDLFRKGWFSLATYAKMIDGTGKYLHVNGEFKQRRFEQRMLTLIELLFSCRVVLEEFSGELFL